MTLFSPKNAAKTYDFGQTKTGNVARLQLLMQEKMELPLT